MKGGRKEKVIESTIYKVFCGAQEERNSKSF
jgi:hypothetical protein